MTARDDDGALPPPSSIALGETMQEGPTRRLYGDELAAGALVGDWLIERTQYHSAGASLYRAHHVRDALPAAIKVLSAGWSTSPQLLQRFERERDALNQLHHRHIVEILGSGALADGRPFIAMEWLEGRDLDLELRVRGTLSPAEVLSVAEQVGAALTAAHAIGIVHRDLKSQNVMATPHGPWLHLTLVDFGVAKLLETEHRRAESLTSTGMVVGTPLAMAPEQVRAETVDARTDVYAFGVLLFQCLTGRLPFVADTIVELEELHVSAPPPDPCQLAPISPALGQVLLRCLEKRPEQRFSSVMMLMASLRAAIAGGTMAAARPLRSIGVLIGCTVDAAVTDPDDAMFDDLEALLDMARRACREEALTLGIAGGNALLATARLPAEPDEERAARGRLIRWALALATRLAARPTRQSAVHVALSIDVADDERGGTHPLDLATPADFDGVALSDAAGDGIDGLALRPIGGTTRLSQVVAIAPAA